MFYPLFSKTKAFLIKALQTKFTAKLLEKSQKLNEIEKNPKGA
jgi:hypothetical protein